MPTQSRARSGDRIVSELVIFFRVSQLFEYDIKSVYLGGLLGAAVEVSVGTCRKRGLTFTEWGQQSPQRKLCTYSDFILYVVYKQSGGEESNDNSGI